MATSINNEPPIGVPAKSIKDEEGLKALQELFKSVDKKKLSALLNERPNPKKSRYSKRTVLPYYKERFGLEFQAVVDAMMREYAAGKLDDREWKYKDLPGYSYNTIYNRVNQSKAYLLEQLDVNGIYASFLSLTSIRRRRTGVRLSYCDDIRQPDDSFMPIPVIPEKKIAAWKLKLQEFLEKGKEGERFLQKGLALTAEDKNEIEMELGQVKGLLFEVNDDYVKLIKIPIDQWERINE